MFIPVLSNEAGTETMAQVSQTVGGYFRIELAFKNADSTLLISSDESAIPTLLRDMAADLTTLAAQIESRLPKVVASVDDITDADLGLGVKDD